MKFKIGDRVVLPDYENRDMLNYKDIQPNDIGVVMEVGINGNEYGLTEVFWDSGSELYHDEDDLIIAHEEDYLSFREKIKDRLG